MLALSTGALSARGSAAFEGQRVAVQPRAAAAPARAALNVQAVQNFIGEVVSTKMQKSVVVTVRRQARYQAMLHWCCPHFFAWFAHCSRCVRVRCRTRCTRSVSR